MKNWKKSVFFGIVAVIVLSFGFVGCDDKDDPIPQKVTMSDVPTSNGTVSVTINYTALPGTTPSYMSTLKTVLGIILESATTNGDLTINVIAGNGEFVLAGTKTLSVGESWVSNATDMEMGRSIMGMLNSWVAMLESNANTKLLATKFVV
jgi:hypothetical protein